MMRRSRTAQLAHWLFVPLAFASMASFALAAAPDNADDKGAHYRFNDDVFAAGSDTRVTDLSIEDLFAAGRTVAVDADVRETAHLAGRTVRVNRAVGENVYAAGYEVDVGARVGKDVIAAGNRVEIGANASVEGDVLAAGRTVVVRGPVAGNVRLMGQTVEIAGPISGSADIRAREIRFVDGARIDGTLSYSSREAVDVPANVITPDRVTVNAEDDESVGAAGWIAVGVTVLALMLALTALFAFVFRNRLATTRAVIAARPWRDLLLGVVATSALFGSILVLGVSLIGIPLIPFVILFAPFVLLAGYLTTAHAIGALLVKRARLAPGSFWAAFGAILLGVLVLALVSAIPLLGWVIAVLAVIVGIGAWFALILSPSTRGQEAAAA
jgi:cytoskeletal protein CcmA (bactofilin family)